MSELKIITVRDSDTVAAEINTIKETARKVMITSAIMIGGKLAEAKSMVPHGEWGKWLEEKVEYSQSTADNLMKLHREYGQGQASLFDNWTNSEAFAKMSYTQHLAMLALPFEDRLKFAEEHNADQMSTRELDKAVKEELESLKKQLAGAEERIAGAQADKQKADREKTMAEKSEKSALDLAGRLQGQLDAAAKEKKELEAELKRARENPDVPDSVMQAMRLEIEAEAARKAEEKVAKKLDEANKSLQKETEARAAAERRAEDAVGALEAAKKVDKMSNPDVAAYNALAESMMEAYNRLEGYRLKVTASDPDAGERLTNFQRALLAKWGEPLR